jgi:metal-responsive CopG/Arc/MetJ family transcriptional regulator
VRSPTTRTTISLPIDLLEAVDRVVREGQSRSRNEFVSDAVRSALAAAERARIDAEFAAMAEDAAYQQEASEIAQEFDVASWEAVQAAEARE